MPLVEFDLRGLAPGRAPERAVLAEAPDADSLLVRGPVPALAGVLAVLHAAGRTAEVPVSWDPADDSASRGLARDLGIGSGGERELSLVRDDHGGVLLQHGRYEAAEKGRLPLAARLGVQAHHDDARVADGMVARIDVRPDWTAVDTIRVVVSPQLMRPPRRSSGRALQLASDPARVTRDGVPYPRPVSRWTWYADDRVRWRLRP
ncbi:hypothetical protein GCM10027261_42300 [Geodermatophilus arenarius]|uniref:Uncharacterized protein n=1 Tax=Geodermatophilus arenarius TaxID=1137990 RepID=A0ABV9LPR6_9ACTN